MGSEGESNNISDTVGTLVWVRRRNGSWWPGRVVGLHELSEGCLVSPRSGTPVKLLGREDASVDWYNLDKSKRVKAFRCGEYDECIEKAKASAANINKKAVKYARREDAILHALEIENAHESDEQPVSQSKKGNSAQSKSSQRVRKLRNGSSSGREHDDMDGKESISEVNLTKELSQSGISFEDPNLVSTPQVHCLQKMRRKTPNDSEDDDGSQGTKRMRGLEDLGMGVSNRKTSVHSDSEGSDELVEQDSASFSEPNTSSLSNGSTENRSKKREAQVALVHENGKRKSRCLPLTQVLESTTMVSIPVNCDQVSSPSRSSLQGVADSKVSVLESADVKKESISPVVNDSSNCTGASCDNEILLDASAQTCDTGVDAENILSDPKCSDSHTMLEVPENVTSDGLFDVPFVKKENHTQDASGELQSGASERRPDNCSKVGPIPLSNEGRDESGSTSLIVDVKSLSPTRTKHTSKWQSKGKRNSRLLSHRTSKGQDARRCLDGDPEYNVSLAGKNHRYLFSQGLDRKVEIDPFDEPLALDSPHRSRDSERNYLDSNYGWRNYLVSEDVDQLVGRKDGHLNLSHEKSVSAKLATQVRNKDLYLRDESVSPLPHRSLPYRQSRFTPNSRYQDAYVPTRTAFGNSSLFDVNLEVRASYRGRHVPLVSLMSKLNGKAIVGHPVTVEVCEDGTCDLMLKSIGYCLASSSSELYEVPGENMSDQSTDVSGASLTQYDTGYVQSPATHLSFKSSVSPKKSPNGRKGGFSSKKTRRLSSFATAQREQDRKPMVEKLGGPSIACVPLKVVFSRINEALNGSARSTQRKLTLGNM